MPITRRRERENGNGDWWTEVQEETGGGSGLPGSQADPVSPTGLNETRDLIGSDRGWFILLIRAVIKYIVGFAFSLSSSISLHYSVRSAFFIVWSEECDHAWKHSHIQIYLYWGYNATIKWSLTAQHKFVLHLGSSRPLRVCVCVCLATWIKSLIWTLNRKEKMYYISVCVCACVRVSDCSYGNCQDIAAGQCVLSLHCVYSRRGAG